MYKAHADRRDGYMLDIKDFDSRKEFEQWYHSEKWSGSHPFEILFHFQSIGITLFPPYNKEQKYILNVSQDDYIPYFLKMLESLIDTNTPFIAWKLNDILDYICGETDFTVNQGGDRDLSYYGDKFDKKKYFKHIKWDKLRFLKHAKNP
ncbi:MAG: hypothetical protein LHV68_08060 [Elusimicrobia bacterium]|nr:hypothetical protein [Candidatus Liberimonas magnetica]